MDKASQTRDLVNEVLIQGNHLSQDQVDRCRRDHEEAGRLGVRISFLKFLQDKGLIDSAKLADIQKELMRRGLRPRLGEYEILEKLGEGGMGSVYKARHPRLNSIVAIKVLLPEIARDKSLAERFMREARLAAQLQDADIVQVLDMDQADGKQFIVMQFVDGESLQSRIDREGELSETDALRIVRDVARTLAIAHRQQIVHRDIKPSNIMLTRAGRVKVCDLGLAKSVERDGPALTESGTAMGTPHYIAPEQARSTKSVDGRADIYSLGATLFHMVTGTTPYKGSSSYEIILKHVTEPPPDAREANAAITAATAMLIQRMMIKNPDERVGTCDEVVQNIETILASAKDSRAQMRTVATPSAGVVTQDVSNAQPAVARPASARWLTVGAAALAGAGVVVWVVWAAGSEGKATATKPTTTVARTSPATTIATPPSTTRMPTTTVAASRADGTASGALSTPAPDSPQSAAPQKRTIEFDLGGGVSMELVHIPPGEFLMGSPENETGRRGDESPQHRVRITKGFYMGITEVTQAQYEAAMGANPSHFKGREWPVGVSWSDAVEFCKHLSARTGREVRLPTEAEWEYACRAGTTTRYYFGDTDAAVGDYAWHQGNTGNTPKPVGQRRANPWGLYDMGGSFFEWCQDWYDGSYYGKSPLLNPTGPPTGQPMPPDNRPTRVVRGSSWNTQVSSGDVRSAARNCTYPDRPCGNNGFRVVCNATDSTPAAPPAPSPTLPTTPAAKTLDLDCGGVTMVLVRIPPGEFMMGGPDSEPARAPEEGPQHRVRITRAFYMGVTEVTQAQYQAAMGKNPSKFKYDQNPVEMVPWSAAVEFCKRLSARTGREVRLPTEAEWEYACRAGTTTRFFFGEKDADLGDYAWYAANSGRMTRPVGQKRPNPWGLHDMAGNVVEWCMDWHARGYYHQSPYADPPGPETGDLCSDGGRNPPEPTRVVRGGSWLSSEPRYLRSAARERTYPDTPGAESGFRVVCNVP